MNCLPSKSFLKLSPAQEAMLKSGRCGEIKRLVMGLDRFHKTPCGFCFVEYYNHQDALDCMKYIGGTKLDERIIRTDLDPGFQEGRQYGWVDLLKISLPGAFLTDTFTLGEGSLAVKFATSTATNMIQDAEATAVQSPPSVKRRKMSTAREGSVRFGNTAGVSSRTSSGKMCKNMRDMDHFRDSCRVRFSCVKLRGYHESTESRISIIVRALQENSFFSCS